MVKNKRGITGIVVAFCFVALTALAGIAQADMGEGGWGGEHCGKNQHHNFNRFSKNLGLTDDQKGKAKVIFQANKETVKTLLANLKAGHVTLQTLMHADTIDEAAIRTETAKLGAIQADLNVNRAKVGAQFRALLTPSQLATLKTIHHKRDKKIVAPATPAE